MYRKVSLSRAPWLVKLLPLLLILGACATGAIREKQLTMPVIDGATSVGQEVCVECHEGVKAGVHSRLAALVACIRKRIERDQVDLGWHPFKYAGQLACVPITVIDTIQHDIFKRDPAPALTDIFLAGLQQFAYRILPVKRHQFIA